MHVTAHYRKLTEETMKMKMNKGTEVVVKSLLVLFSHLLAQASTQDEGYLPFVMLNTTDGVEIQQLGRFDDGASPAIFIPGGVPFGNSIHSFVFVATNGIISFDEPFDDPRPSAFPGSSTEVNDAYLVAPYWSDVDIRMEGDILYEIHTADDNPRSDMLLAQVSEFVYNQTGEDFSGTWMLVAQWNGVHPYPAGSNTLRMNFADVEDENTYQGIVITNGTSTYAVFVYRCGFMEWSRGGVTIGYNAAGDYFENHPLTGSAVAHTIACANSPAEWNNVIYKLSVENIVTPSPPPTIEPPQSAYLPFLERTGINSQTLTGCDDCSAFINLTANTRFPMSYYLHDSIWVTSNGIISLGRNFTRSSPALFPTERAESYYAFLVSPYWSDADLQSEGEVYWEIHTTGTAVSEDLLDRVNGFIADEYGDTQFTGNWMLVANWSGVHPYPQDDPEEIARDPHLQLANTYQAILITNSTKSYAVFTYHCDLMEWSDDAAIGFNAAAELFENHPLSGLTAANVIGCVHTTEDSDLNNVIYDLVPDGLLANASTPQPFPSIAVIVRYVDANYNVDENAGLVEVCVEATGEAMVTLSTVNVTGAGGTATGGGTDYQDFSQILTLNGSQLCVNITIVDDIIVEDPETIMLMLMPESANSTVDIREPIASITITDTSTVTVELDQDSYTVNEADGMATVCAQIVGLFLRDVTVGLSTSSDHAVAPADYDATPQPSSLVFNPGATLECATITIEDDGDNEETAEQFFVFLDSSVDSAVMLGTSSAVVTIVDPPLIITQPMDRYGVLPDRGIVVTYTVLALGSNLMYQWQRNTTDFRNISNDMKYSGTGTATLTVRNVTEEDGGSFRCVISNMDLDIIIISDPAQLTISLPPNGPPLNFEVTVEGPRDLSFSWDPPAEGLRNGAIIGYQLSCSPQPNGLPRTFNPSEFNSGGGVEARLSGFAPSTTYTCSVLASTTGGDGPAANKEAITEDDSMLFQLQLNGIPNCTEWVLLDTIAKLQDIRSAVQQNVERLCQCGFSEEHIPETEGVPVFRCFLANSNKVIFRARLNGTAQATSSELISDIEQWIAGDVTINVQREALEVESSCRPVAITSTSDPECEPPRVSSQSSDNTAAVIGGTIVVVVVVIILSIVIIIIIVFVLRNGQAKLVLQKKQWRGTGEPVELTAIGIVGVPTAPNIAYETTSIQQTHANVPSAMHFEEHNHQLQDDVVGAPPQEYEVIVSQEQWRATLTKIQDDVVGVPPQEYEVIVSQEQWRATLAKAESQEHVYEFIPDAP